MSEWVKRTFMSSHSESGARLKRGALTSMKVILGLLAFMVMWRVVLIVASDTYSYVARH
jgi:hypothetical protein